METEYEHCPLTNSIRPKSFRYANSYILPHEEKKIVIEPVKKPVFRIIQGGKK